MTNIEVRKVTEDVLMFVWFKQGALSEEPLRESGLIPKISDELMDNLSHSIWIESFRSQFVWEDFFKKHFERMTSSSKLFANYLAFACYVLKKHTNVYECFFDILSIVTEFSLRCLEGDRIEYVNTCVELFCVFFQKELCTNFADEGGWKNFNEHIGKQYNLRQLKSRISESKSAFNLFEYFQEEIESSNRPDHVVSRVVRGKRRPYYVVNGIVLKDITHNEVETDEKAVTFALSIQEEMEELVQKTFSQLIGEFSNTYIHVKKLYSREFEQEFMFTNYDKKKRRREQLSSKKIQEPPGNSKVMQRETDKKSSDEIKKQGKQCISQKVQELPIGMKSQKEQCSTRKVQELPFGMKRQKEQCSTREVHEHPGRIDSKGMQRKIIQEPSGGIKNQANNSSLKVEESSEIISSKTKAEKRDEIKKELEVETDTYPKPSNTQTLNTFNLKDRFINVQALHIELESTEEVKILLSEISLALTELFELIPYL